jgi:hypothetical protein
MIVSVIKNLQLFTPVLKKHIQQELKSIFSEFNSYNANLKILFQYYNNLFIRKNKSPNYICELKNWSGLSTIYRGLLNNGGFSANDKDAFHLADTFPTILLFNKREYLLSWEFLHYLGSRKFFQKEPFLLSYLYSLNKKNLLYWASWLSPTLNLYARNDLIEFIYSYCLHFREPFEIQRNFEDRQVYLDSLLPGNSRIIKDHYWMQKKKMGLYRFLQKWNLTTNSDYSKQFKYGMLICRDLSSIKEDKTNYEHRMIVQVPLEFKKRIS